MGKDVIVALDFATGEETLAFLKQFEGRKPYVKIGMELYYAEGAKMVEEIADRGHEIFLDLKLHDIPNTVEKAMAVLSRLPIAMCNVHAAGTIPMMEAALRGLTRSDGTRPLLLAVTQLTSTNQARMQAELAISGTMEDIVLHYAKNTATAGLDGVVCSPLEAEKIHRHLGADFLTVTPGIRFAQDAKGDQERITTPAKAKALGADYIVVGRSITQANDPEAAYRQCLQDFGCASR